MANLKATIQIDSSAAVSSLKTLASEGDKSAKQINDAFKNALSAKISTADGAKAFDGVRKAAQAAVTEQKSALASMLAQGQGGTKAFADLKTQLISAAKEARKLDDALKEVDTQIDVKVNADTNGIGAQLKNSIGGSVLGGIIGGGVATAVSGGISAIAAGFSSAITLGQEYETALKSVSAVTGVTGEGLAVLGDNAIELSKTFGGSATEQLEVFQVTLSKIGPQLAQSPKDLKTFSESVNLLSKTDGALGAAGAVDALTGSMLQFGVNVNDSGEVARESSRFINVLAASAGVGSASVSQVAEAIAVTGATAKNANVSFEETNAALQVLASKSLVGSQAGTGLATVFNKLQSQSKDGDDALKALGTSSAELGQLLNEKGLGPAMAKLRESMAKLGTQAERNALLNKLFGEGGQNAAAALLSGGDMLEQFTQGVTGTNAATEQAAINMNTLSERMSRVKANLEAALLTAFKAILPVLNGFLDNIGNIAPYLGVAAVAIGAFALAANASAIATAVASTATAAWNAILALNPAVAIGAAVALLAVGVYAVADAMHVSAKEALGEAESQKKLIETQIKSNAERKLSVAATKSLATEFEQLAAKTNRTAQEEARLREIQQKLDAQYPSLIDQTKSFKDNLVGVAKVGQAATAELGRLGEAGNKLQKQLAEQVRLIGFAKRNVAVDELRDVLGGFGDDTKVFVEGFVSVLTGRRGLAGLKSETLNIRTAFASARSQFEQGVFGAKTAEQVDAAQAKLLEFVNTQLKGKLDADVLLEIYGKINNAADAARSALRGQTDAQTDTAKAAADAAKAAADAAAAEKDADANKKTALQQALAAYAQERKAIENNNAALRDAVELRKKLGEITPVQADVEINAIDRAEAEALQAKVQSTLKAVIDDRGLFLKSSIRLGKDDASGVAETHAEIQREANRLALKLALPVELEITDVVVPVEPPKLKQPFKLRKGALELDPDEIAEMVRKAQIGTDVDIGEEFGLALKDNITGTFDKLAEERSAAAKNAADALKEEESNLTESLKSRTIDIASFYKDTKALREKARQDESIGVAIAKALGAGALKSAGDAVAKFEQKATQRFNAAAEAGVIAFDQLGLVAASALGVGLTEAIAAGETSMGSLLQVVANAAVKALDLLAPIISAQYLGFLGVFGLPLATAAVLSLRALLQTAISGIGADQGVVGLTRAYKTRATSRDVIPVMMRVGESAIVPEATQRNRGALEWMNRTHGDVIDYALQTASRERLMRALDLESMGISFAGLDKPRIDVASHPQVVVLRENNAMLERELRGMRKEIRALKGQINTQQAVHVIPQVDAGGFIKSIEAKQAAIIRRH